MATQKGIKLKIKLISTFLFSILIFFKRPVKGSFPQVFHRLETTFLSSNNKWPVLKKRKLP